MVWGFCVYFVYMIPLETDVLRKHRFQKISKTMRLFLRLKSHVTMHIFLKQITHGSLKCRLFVFLSSTLYALCIETKINFVYQNKGKITLKIFPWAE